MGNNDISEKLQSLARGKNRSATARIREIFNEIENALRAGVPRKDVHKVLMESGISLSFASFELAVYRIRKENKGVTTTNSKLPNHSHATRPEPVLPATGNPLRVLSGKAREGEHSAIPLAKFEVDNT